MCRNKMKNNCLFGLLLFVAFAFAGCGDGKNSSATTPLNSNMNSDVNQDSNLANSNQLENEVPVFTDSREAYAKGDEYLDASRNKDAISAFKQATELDPDYADAYFKLGVAYSLTEDDDTPVGLDDEESSNKEKKENSKSNSEIAFENAVKSYKKHVKKNPKDAQAYHNLGLSYNKLFEDDDARRALQKAVDLNPDDSEYRTDLGAVEIKLARYREAIRQLEKAIELDDQNFRAEDLLAKAKAGRKRTNFSTEKKKTKPVAKSTAKQTAKPTASP